MWQGNDLKRTHSPLEKANSNGKDLDLGKYLGNEEMERVEMENYGKRLRTGGPNRKGLA